MHVSWPRSRKQLVCSSCVAFAIAFYSSATRSSLALLSSSANPSWHPACQNPCVDKALRIVRAQRLSTGACDQRGRWTRLLSMPGDIDREGYRSLPSQVPSTSQGKSKWKEGSKAGFSVVADYGTCQEVAVRSALSESGRVKLPALLQLVDAERFPSPSTAKKRIRQGAVLVNGRKGKVDTLVAIGADRVTLQVRTESAYKPLGKAPFEIEVIYEDDYMAVVRKPAGVCTHPPKGGIKASSVSDGDEDEDGEEDEDEDEVREEDEQEGELRHRKDGRMDMMSMRSCIGFHVSCAPAGMEGVLWRPMLVHRLDKATEGLQVVAKTKPAYIGLQRQFAKRLIKKQYAAVVEGEVQGDAGVIDLAVDHKAAVSRWQVAARYRSPALGGSHLTLLHVWPQHGRKHQIRLHCARGLGCSIVGDHRYGGTLVRPYGLLLCAIGLELKHPMTGVDLSLSLPLPDRFLAMPRQQEEAFRGSKDNQDEQPLL